MRFRHATMVLMTGAVIASGCGETISADQRVDRCLKKQPDATRSECQQWEKDGELQDSGIHEDHESM